MKMTHHPKTARNVCSKHPRLNGLHVSPDIRLLVQHVAISGLLVQDGLLFVGVDNVGMVGLHHQQCLTQCTRTLAEHLQARQNQIKQ